MRHFTILLILVLSLEAPAQVGMTNNSASIYESSPLLSVEVGNRTLYLSIPWNTDSASAVALVLNSKVWQRSSINAVQFVYAPNLEKDKYFNNSWELRFTDGKLTSIAKISKLRSPKHTSQLNAKYDSFEKAFDNSEYINEVLDEDFERWKVPNTQLVLVRTRLPNDEERAKYKHYIYYSVGVDLEKKVFYHVQSWSKN